MTNAEALAERPEELARIIHDYDGCCEYCAYAGKCDEEVVDCEAGILEWLEAERD